MAVSRVVRSPWMGVAALAAALTGVVVVQAGNAPAPAQRAAPSAVGIIDLQRLIGGLDAVRAGNVQVKKIADAYQARLNELKEDYEKTEAAFKTLTPDDPNRYQKRLELEEKKITLQARYEGSQKIIAIEMGRILRPLYNDVLLSCETLAQQQGLDLIIVDDRSLKLPEAENLTDAQLKQVIESKQVLYAANKVDVTDDLVTLMNNQFKAGVKPGAAAAKPAGNK